MSLDVQMIVAARDRRSLGSVVGYERERVGKQAGVRTHGMVSLGAALFTVVSVQGFGGAGDPARVAAQIVAGIGLICAGAQEELQGVRVEPERLAQPLRRPRARSASKIPRSTPAMIARA